MKKRRQKGPAAGWSCGATIDASFLWAYPTTPGGEKSGWGFGSHNINNNKKLKSYSWLITILVTCTVGVVKSQNTGRRPCVACPVAERHRILTAPLFNSYWLQVCKYLPTQLSISPVCLFGLIRPPRNKGITQGVLHFLPRFSWPEVFSNWNKVPTSITLYTALSMTEHLASILTTCIVCIRPITYQTSRGQSDMLGCY